MFTNIIFFKKHVYSQNTPLGSKIKEKPVMKVELAGLSPMFPVIIDIGTEEIPLWASTTKPAAEFRLTGEGDIALADICENE